MGKTKTNLSYRLSRDSEPITIKKSLPKNYEIIEGTLTQPPGTRWVRKKGEPLFKRDKTGKITGKNPQYKSFLVVTDEDYFTTRIAEDRVYNPKEAADFTVDTALEAKISAKEKRLRKELQKRKEEDAQAVARAIAAREKARAKSKPKAQPLKQDKPPKAVAPVKAKPAGVPKKPKAKTYTVSGRTFATLAEAKAFKALQKQRAGKPCEIKEGNRKPTHKVVSFTAKNK